MDTGLQELINYITEQRRLGIPKETIRRVLLESNWDTALIDHAFVQAENTTGNQQVTASLPATSNTQVHRVRDGVLWILSPFLVLFASVAITIIVKFAGINSPIVNIILLLLGLAGVVLIFVGPVVGIIKLARNK